MSIVVVTQEGGPATRTPASVYVFITKKKKMITAKIQNMRAVQIC